MDETSKPGAGHWLRASTQLAINAAPQRREEGVKFRPEKVGCLRGLPRDGGKCRGHVGGLAEAQPLQAAWLGGFVCQPPPQGRLHELGATTARQSICSDRDCRRLDCMCAFDSGTAALQQGQQSLTQGSNKLFSTTSGPKCRRLGDGVNHHRDTVGIAVRNQTPCSLPDQRQHATPREAHSDMSVCQHRQLPGVAITAVQPSRKRRLQGPEERFVSNRGLCKSAESDASSAKTQLICSSS
mmetsp:Transcript_90621/g.230588  ORF Transcript_90621/g.230588 Transcript_90621/m.230588 type:complete len:240 (+) Transcript_90621:332-1051(+)